MHKILLMLVFVFFLSPLLQAQSSRIATSVGNIVTHAGTSLFGGDGLPEAMNNSLEMFNNYLDRLSNYDEMMSAHNALGSNECLPDFSQQSGADFSINCNRKEDCIRCYTGASQKILRTRQTLARLRCIYLNTKNLTESSIAFGDNVSGIHAVSGLAWQKAKANINASFDRLKQSYNSKYDELMEKLKNDLLAFDKCELKSGNPNWYNRYGYMYYDMMALYYKRPD